MTEEEMKAAIKEAVDSAKADMQSEIDKLKTKNAQLIDEKKAAKAEADAAKDAADEAAEAKAKADGDLAALEASVAKRFEKQITALTNERDAANVHLNTLLVDHAISKALVENNVPAHMHEPLTAMFKTKSSVKDGKAIMDDADLSEGINAYFASDTGKHFVSAPVNTGTGATGSNKIATAWANPPKTAEEFTAFGRLARDNPVEANAHADRWNMPELKV